MVRRSTFERLTKEQELMQQALDEVKKSEANNVLKKRVRKMPVPSDQSVTFGV